MTANPKSLRKAEEALAKTGGASVDRQIFLCAISEKQKCCRRDEGKEAWNYLKKRLKELGLAGRDGTVQRTKAACKSARRGRSRSSGPTTSGTIPAAPKFSRLSSSAI